MADLVPEEAIEAAALAQRSPSHKQGPPDPDLVAIWKRTARITLEAAAPLILAAELRRLADEIGATAALAHESAGDDGAAALAAVAELGVAAKLRARASVLRGEGDPK